MPQKAFRLFATTALAFAGLVTSALANDVLFLAEDVPAGLDYDGPAAAIPTSQTGMVNLMEPLVYYATKEVNSEGVAIPDFTKFEGRLAESWSYDPKTLTWTFKLRPNVKSCDGSTLSADDIIYTFARAKSVSGAAPMGGFSPTSDRSRTLRRPFSAKTTRENRRASLATRSRRSTT